MKSAKFFSFLKGSESEKSIFYLKVPMHQQPTPYLLGYDTQKPDIHHFVHKWTELYLFLL